MTSLLAVSGLHCRGVLGVFALMLLPAGGHGQTVTATLETGSAPGYVVVNPVTNKIYVSNADDVTVTVIDGLTDSTETIAVGSKPFEMAVNPVTNKVYVIHGSGAVTVIDGSTNTTETLAAAGGAGGGVAVNPVTNKIYVTRYGSTMAVIDGATNTITKVTVGSAGVVAVNPVTNKIYVACGNCGYVNVVDGDTNSVTRVKIGLGHPSPAALAINAATNKIYVADGGGNVTVIDGATNGTTTVTSGSGTGRVRSDSLAINPVTNTIYVTNPETGIVTVIDGVTNKSTSIAAGGVGGGGGPGTVTVNATNNQIYVGNDHDNTVIAIDGASHHTTTLAVGKGPESLVVNPVTNKVYAVNSVDSTVTVIDGATNHEQSTPPDGLASSSVAVNPVTNKIYVGSYGSVVVIDGATFSETGLPTVFGGGATKIAVNPVTNKIYVGNVYDFVFSVIDGATNTTTRLGAVGSVDSIAVNPVTNKIYATDSGSSAVSVIDGVTNANTGVRTGFGRHAVAVNPATNKIYVTNGDSDTVTVIDGATNRTKTVATGFTPIAVAVNPLTDKIYVANSRSANITVIDGVDNSTTTLPVDQGPVAVAVNPVTNKIYVVNSSDFRSPSNDVTVIDGATNTTTTLAAGENPSSVTVNPVTNKIYVTNKYSVMVIDGASNITTTLPSKTQLVSAALDPVTNKIYVPDTVGSVTVITEQQVQRSPLTTSITPLPGNQTDIPNPSFTFSVRSSSTDSRSTGVYFQVDTWQNAWTAATGSNSTYEGTVPALEPGFHILYAYAVDGQEATSTQIGSPLIGGIRAYGFLVHGFQMMPASSTTSLAVNPERSIFGLPVLLTATVKAANGTPSGPVTFSYGSTLLGTGTLDASGTATLTTATLPVGNDLVTATYVGGEAYAGSAGSATATVIQGAMPTVISVSPTSGTGLSQKFTAVYSDGNGISDLDTVRLLINSSDSTLNGCYVFYSPSTNGLYMTDNFGNEAFAPFAPGSTGSSAGNSQCTLTGAGSTVSISGNTVTVTFALSFASSFSGLKNVYLQAVRKSGLSSGTIPKGTWRVPASGITLSRTSYLFTSNPHLPQSGRIYITNNDSKPITFSPMIQGSGAFQINKTCSVIQPNAVCGLEITYTPIQLGSVTATLQLNPQNGTSNAVSTVALTGVSVSPSVLFSRTALTFIAPRGNFDYERVYITNNLPYTLNAHPVVTPNYQMVFLLQNDCSAIPAFTTCALNVSFSTVFVDDLEDSYLAMNFVNAPASTPSSVHLQANSYDKPAILVSTTNLQLVTPLGTSTSAPISITNYTFQPVSVHPVINGSAAFTLGNTCSILDPFKTCTINVNYSPVSSQVDTAKIVLNLGNAPADSPANILLQGFAPDPSQVSLNGQNITSSVALSTNAGTFQTSVVTVLNGTAHVLKLAPFLSGSSSFQLSQPCTSIPSHGICMMTVVFAPTTTGSFDATLNVNPTNLQAGDAQSVPQIKFYGSGLVMPSQLE